LAPATLLRWGLGVRGGRAPARTGLILVALLLGVPFGLFSRVGAKLYEPAPTVAAPMTAAQRRADDARLAKRKAERAARPPETAALAAGGGHLEKHLEARADGRVWLPPRKLGGLAFVLLGFAALAFGLRDRARRVGTGIVMAAALTCAALLFWPALCTWVAERGRLELALPRLAPVLSTLLFAGIVCAAGEALARMPRAALAWSLAALLTAAAGTQLLGHAPYSFAEHWAHVVAPLEERRAMIDMHHARQRLLVEHVPAGTVVVAEQRVARYVVMLHDVRVLAADRGISGVPDLRARRRDIDRMTAKGTSWRERRALLERHRLRYVVFETRRQDRFQWALERGHLLGVQGGLQLVLLGERAPAPAS
jgi:hypothetical protein